MATAMAAATDLRTGVSEAEYKKLASKLLVRVSVERVEASVVKTCAMQTVDMTAELTTEAVEIITTSVEKHAASKNYEVPDTCTRTQSYIYARICKH
jgi:hypothetical protein